MLLPAATVAGLVTGTWRLRAGRVETEPFARLAQEDVAALAAEAEDVARFTGRLAP